MEKHALRNKKLQLPEELSIPCINSSSAFLNLTIIKYFRWYRDPQFISKIIMHDKLFKVKIKFIIRFLFHRSQFGEIMDGRNGKFSWGLPKSNWVTWIFPVWRSAGTNCLATLPLFALKRLTQVLIKIPFLENYFDLRGSRWVYCRNAQCISLFLQFPNF